MRTPDLPISILLHWYGIRKGQGRRDDTCKAVVLAGRNWEEAGQHSTTTVEAT